MGIRNIHTFGKNNVADVQFRCYELLGAEQVRLSYVVLDEEIEFIMPLIPKHLASNFAACFATISALGLPIAPAVEVISNFKPSLGRGAVVLVVKNNKNYTLICDYYNSNPESLKAALNYLGQFDNKHKIAVIGDMLELGQDEISLHRQMVSYIVNSGVTKVILVGKLIAQVQDELPREIQIMCYADVDQCILHIEEDLIDGATILLKASRSIKLDKIAKYLGVVDVV
jgi:UDP-N-acetylmuramoyl-tripeptide--D-alanyl-D-alanine ligase